MSKRFTEANKWTQNKWFRKLNPDNKLFWLFILDNCDQIGLWEEDIELASMLIGHEYTKEILLNEFKDKITLIENGKKWWIKDFISFQYGVLVDSEKNKPHKYYISLLKKYSLWIPYTKTIQSLKDKVKDKEKEKGIPEWKKDFEVYKNELRSAFALIKHDKEFIKERERYHPNLDIILSIEKACTDFWAKESGWKNKKDSKTIDIDWKETFVNALTMKNNQVWKQKQEDKY